MELFPLFHLPVLASDNVLSLMVPCEILNLSKTSDKTKKTVRNYFRTHPNFEVSLNIYYKLHVLIHGSKNTFGYGFKLEGEEEAFFRLMRPALNVVEALNVFENQEGLNDLLNQGGIMDGFDGLLNRGQAEVFNILMNINQNLLPNLEQNLNLNPDQNLGENQDQNLDQHLERNVGQNVNLNLHQNQGQDQHQNQDLNQDQAQDLNQNLDQDQNQELNDSDNESDYVSDPESEDPGLDQNPPDVVKKLSDDPLTEWLSFLTSCQEVFNFGKIQNFILDLERFPEYQAFINLIKNSDVGSIVVCNGSDNDVKYILESLRITKELYINSDISENFRAHIPETSKRIQIEHCRWMVLEDLLRLRSSRILLRNNKFSPEDINIFLKTWMSQECHQNLKMIQIDMAFPRNELEIVFDLENKVVDPAEIRVYKYFFGMRRYRGGIDIKRIDGTTGTIFISRKHLTMIVH